MAHVYTEEQNLVDIANAIREKNGTDNTYAPSEMASAIGDLKVGELDFSSIYDQEQANELNQYYKDGIAYAEEIKAENPNPSGSWSKKFYNNEKLVFLPPLDLSNVTTIGTGFNSCTNLIAVREIKTSSKLVSISWAFQYCYSLKWMPIEPIDLIGCTTLNSTFHSCYNLKRVRLKNMNNITSVTTPFTNCTLLEDVQLNGWKQTNLTLAWSSQLSTKSIKNIIFHAINSTDGASARDLTLHATAYAKWVEIKDTTPTDADKAILGVEDLVEYATMTWDYIAKTIKGITIKSA